MRHENILKINNDHFDNLQGIQNDSDSVVCGCPEELSDESILKIK